MDMQLIEKVTAKQIRKDFPQFKAGDTVKVYVKIKEGNKDPTYPQSFDEDRIF